MPASLNGIIEKYFTFDLTIKNNMKKIFLLSALSIAMFGAINAQNAATTETQTANKQIPEVRAKAKVQAVTNIVKLEGAQWGKVNDLFVDYFRQLDATTDAAKSADLTKKVNEKLLTILTPEQAKLWKASNK